MTEDQQLQRPLSSCYPVERSARPGTQQTLGKGPYSSLPQLPTTPHSQGAAYLFIEIPGEGLNTSRSLSNKEIFLWQMALLGEKRKESQARLGLPT